MWLFTPTGFFSIVQKSGTNYLTVRSRVRGDLDNLRRTYLAELSDTQVKAGTDYPYRGTTSHAAFSVALARIASDIGYDNFKNEVDERQGPVRASVYGTVWGGLLMLENQVEAQSTEHRKPSSFGGVIINAGKVLLIEPKRHFDGYVWTFPKGPARHKESPEVTAWRKVLEETGKWVVVVAAIPGRYSGGTTDNQYFLMRLTPLTKTSSSDEVESVRWADYSEARSLIRMSTNEIGVRRDLAVLDAAYLIWHRVEIDEQHKFESREPTNRGNCSNVKPMEEPTESIKVDREFTDAEMDLIRRGSLPHSSDDKWFLFWEAGHLHACRSFTGYTIFLASIENRTPGRWVVGSVETPRNAWKNAQASYPGDLLAYLIDTLLLRRPTEAPGSSLA